MGTEWLNGLCRLQGELIETGALEIWWNRVTDWGDKDCQPVQGGSWASDQLVRSTPQNAVM
jgi:hypothetical protein